MWPGPGAERKVVTVLFCDLVGFTGRAEQLDPEDVGRVLGPYYASARAVLERFGGTVEKFIGDAVMALFGAPVVHEDDPERAVRAAFAIRGAIEELNAADPELDLQVRIGINTGEAFIDPAAAPLAAGDVVNTAARLQQHAPVAGIVVGEPTYRLTATVVDYLELEPVAAKGKHEPVRAWQAVALPSERPTRRGAELVGRVEELDLLEAAVDGAPAIVTLVGAPGIGKTRLLWELHHRLAAAGRPCRWLRGRCLAYGEEVAYWALGEMVKAEAGILESDHAEAAEAKLEAAVQRLVSPERAEWVERHLRPLVGLAGEQRLAPERRAEAFSAWQELLEALASAEPVVLAFEDLHWADDDLLDFVEHLAQWARGVPLAIICTARLELVERRPAWPGAVRIEPLSRDETRALIASLLDGASFPDAVLAHAAGNPLYAEEYARMLAEPGSAETVPESVQAIVAARLDALDPGAKAVLQDASVIGKSFWPAALATIGTRRIEEVERRLGELQARELVRPQPRSSIAGETQYAFWHALVRDVAYGQIPRARRA